MAPETSFDVFDFLLSETCINYGSVLYVLSLKLRLASAYQEHLKSGQDLVVCSISISSLEKPNLPNVFQRYCMGRFNASKEWSLFVIGLAKSDGNFLKKMWYFW